MNRRFSSFVPLLALLAALSIPAHALNDGAVTGVVRDVKGTPQVGALVQLLRPDLSVIYETFTDDHGHYELPRVLPGPKVTEINDRLKALGDLMSNMPVPKGPMPKNAPWQNAVTMRAPISTQ